MCCPGETAQIMGDIDMTESKADLNKMDVDFVRTISLKADGHYKTIVDVISGKDYLTNGVKPGDKRDGVAMPLPLVGNEIFPSTCGMYLKCEYHVDVNCDISWASDVMMHLPVLCVHWSVQYMVC